MKGLLIAVGVVFAGFVGYKIIQKKNPALIKKIKSSVADAGKGMSSMIEEAKESFYEGYAQG
ncbi:MAG: hypothetical protein HQL26_10620 [Candidatus Omnitrophica bacterium]|nr:hypothetical protein [Candidatus Omnitrophota bacterium]